MPHYVEASALVKLIIDERGSGVLRLWSVGKFMFSSDLSRTEVVRAVRRIAPEYTTAALEVLGQTSLLALSSEIFDSAGLLEPISLRSLDAIHLASAMTLGPELEGFVTYDNRLAEAARFHGIPVFAPTE